MTKYTNSPLVTFTKISPHKTVNRNAAIDTITIHCVAGNMTIEGLGNWFAQPNTNASSQYGIGSDGRIGQYVDEKDRSWCSSSGANDNRAVTIEVANTEAKHPWPISDKAYASLLDLVTDICQRNNIKQLVWRNDKNNPGNITVHNWFAAKACPGEYIQSRLGNIAAEVNRRLGVPAEQGIPTPPPASQFYRVRKTWSDTHTQLGAYSSLANAKEAADKSKKQGYKVFDDFGAMVYDPTTGATTEPTPEEATVDAAAAKGILSDRDYWNRVLAGTTEPKKENIKALIDNAIKLIK